ncbi:E3 ubiquitin-protein ligase PDZRN3-B [Holothuria leucospilota]|uniref:E3 ubiquitin-protein ligase PDZRN3-B n=1 Tax=Holothuria leucospilota TaxID=206669 RepID=A0A9Q1C2Q4_HOLLE|nr:E3 ubiquitin-protein ligase PDZRN3-B [Holothuria leucospilota]
MPRRCKRSRKSSAVADRLEEEEDRYFLNPESVSSHLYCSVCQEVFKDPQRAPCGHSFCRVCIYKWLQQSKTCPEDRRPLRTQDLHSDFIVANIIGDQLVACPYKRKGCEHICKLELLKSHSKSCDFNPCNLPGFLADDDNDNLLAQEQPHSSSVMGLHNLPSSSMTEPDKLPSPVKPSLKMRLFRNGGDTRQTLCAMFERQTENKENEDIICLD